jgi:hypothetical protein
VVEVTVILAIRAAHAARAVCLRGRKSMNLHYLPIK